MATAGRVRDVVVVGAGHNGLIAACYLARAGLDVEVVERDVVAGGAVSTVDRWPGVRVDRGSSIHVMIRHTGIVQELALGELGLVYDNVEPWGVLPHPQEPIRFSQDLDATCTSITSACGVADADAYRQLVGAWTPRMRAFLAAADGPPSVRRLAATMGRVYQTRPRHWGRITREFVEPADTLLARQFGSDRLRAALAWWAAQSGPPPHQPGTAAMAGTVALFHMRPAGRPRGGSGRLSEALVARLRAEGGELRHGDPVTTIDTARAGSDIHVVTESGDSIRTRTVVAACHVAATAELLGQPTAPASPAPGVGLAVRLLTDRLPDYAAAVPGTTTSMQLLVKSSQQIRAAYGDYLRGEPSSDPPLVVMTPTANDDTLAPSGRHVVTIWAQWHPYRLADGTWQQRREAVADGIVATLDAWAPGFSGHVIDRLVQTPLDIEAELGMPGGDVMHVEPRLDQLFGFRPRPGWSAYRSPYRGVYLCGASTHPGGGVWGASGRNVARIVVRDLTRRRRSTVFDVRPGKP